MVKKTLVTAKSKLLSWLLKEPFRFSILSFAMIFGTALIYMLAKNMLTPGYINSPFIFFALLFFVSVFAIYKLLRWLPDDNLDRYSFVAIDNGLTMIYFGAFVAFTVLIAGNAQNILLYTMQLQSHSVILFLIAAIIGSLLYLYVFGLFIANMYATYKRATTMGVPKWKVILSIPFTFTMFWIAGYILPDDKKSNKSIEIKTKWYANLTNWVVKKPINSMIVFLFAITLMGVLVESYSIVLTLLMTALFGIWVLFQGIDKFRKSIGGVFANFVYILNIVILVGLIGFFTFEASKPINSVQTVEITDSVKK